MTSFRLTPFAIALGLASSLSHAAFIGGETPATATPLTSLNFTDTGTTLGFVDNISTLPSGVSNYTRVAGPDVFYSFTVGTAGSATFSVTPSSGFDVAIYLLKDGMLGSNAIIGRDAGFDGASESFTANLLAGSTYYFGVDSFYDSTQATHHSGTYSLTVSSTATLATPGRVPEPGPLGLVAASALAAAGAAGLRRTGWRARRSGKA